jgi:hypothetical protein
MKKLIELIKKIKCELTSCCGCNVKCNQEPEKENDE